MKLSLSYIGLNSDHEKPILVTDGHKTVIATPDQLAVAIWEVDQLLRGLREAAESLRSDSIVEQDIRIEKYLSQQKHRLVSFPTFPDEVAGKLTNSTSPGTGVARNQQT